LLGGSNRQRAVEVRAYTKPRFTAVSAIREGFGRWLARMLHFGNDSAHQFAYASWRVNLTGREP